MASNCLKSPFKSPPDIDNLYDASSMQTSAKIAKALKFPEKEDSQKKQELKKSIANLTTILNLIEFEMQNEQEYDILEALTSQKEILGQILHQKQTGQKSSFKKKENEAVLQLQNLESRLDSKIDSLLQKVESQAQTQTKSYAQMAKTGLEKAKQQSQINEPKNKAKKQEKEEKTLQYREKRLVIQIKKEACESLNSYTLRNQINDNFFKQENINQPVVAAVTKSWTGLSIILTTMPEFSAEFLLQKKAVWKDLFANVATKAEKDVH